MSVISEIFKNWRTIGFALIAAVFLFSQISAAYACNETECFGITCESEAQKSANEVETGDSKQKDTKSMCADLHCAHAASILAGTIYTAPVIHGENVPVALLAAKLTPRTPSGDERPPKSILMHA